MIILFFILACIFFICLESCSSSYQAEPIGFPTSALENALEKIVYDPLINPDATLPKEWWTLFNDDQLSTFIQQIVEINPTLQEARARILAAAYAADRARAIRPQISHGGLIFHDKSLVRQVSSHLAQQELLPEAHRHPLPEVLREFLFILLNMKLN